jgi:hypothetical protein
MINMFTLIMSPGFDFAAKFYETFSTDVSYCGDQILVEKKRISRVVMTSLADLLKALKANIANGERRFLIACHGSPEGLLIHVADGHTTTLTGEMLDRVLSAADNENGARSTLLRTTDKSGRKLFPKESQADDLLKLIRDVRAGKIELIEFRCCNLGAGDGLNKIHKLFGSKITAAPKVKYVWLEATFSGSSIKPPSTSAQWDAERKHDTKRIAALPPNRRTFTYDDCLMPASAFAKGTEVIAGLSVTKEGALNRYDLNGYFPNWKAVKGWTQSFLENSYYYPTGKTPPGGGFTSGGTLYIIGFYTPTGLVPMVFPGDGFSYTDQIDYKM